MALSGCAPLEPIAAGECGNGFVEDGEDCDLVGQSELGSGLACGAPASPQACRYVCTAEARCPQGWGCGADGICRHATGAFREMATTTTTFGAWAIGPLEDEQPPGLVTWSDGRMRVYRGEGDGHFSEQHSLAVPLATGRPEFGAFFDEEWLAAALPTATGVSLFRSEGTGILDPVVSLSAGFGPGKDARPLPVAAEGGTAQLVIFLVEGVEPDPPLYAQAAWFPIDDPGVNGPLLALPEAHVLDDLAGTYIPRANLDDSVDGAADHFGVAFTSSDEVWVLAVRYQDLGADGIRPTVQLEDRVALPAPVDAHGIHFARVDGDGFPDLVAASGGDIYVAQGLGDGTFAPAEIDTRFDALSAADSAIGSVDAAVDDWPLAAGDLDGDGIADYVGANGVFVTDPVAGTLSQVAWRTTVDPWHEAQIGDFNGDGFADVAATAATLSGDPVAGVDLFVNTGAGSFEVTRLPTSVPVGLLVAGDFDGNAVTDLAVVESYDVWPDLWGSQIRVGYGAFGSAPLELAPMGLMSKFDLLGTLRPRVGRVPWGASGPDGADDILFANFTNQLMTGVYVLWGSASQRLWAPFLTPQPPVAAYPYRALSLGRDNAHFVVIMRGDSGYELLLPLSDTVPVATAPVAFDPGCSASAGGDFYGDEQEQLVIVSGGTCDAPGPIILHSVRMIDGELVVASEELGTEEPTASAAAGDFDGDGRLDLAVAFARHFSEMGFPTARGRVAVFWNDGDGPKATGATEVLDLSGGLAPLSVAAAQANADGSDELVILTTSGAYLVEFLADRSVAGTPTVAFEQVGREGATLQAVDVDRDGVVDLAVGYPFVSTLTVYQGLPHTYECTPDDESHVVYLNRHGGAYAAGKDDSSANRSSIIPGDVELEPWSGGEEAWRELVACVRDAFEGFNVRVTDLDPEQAAHVEVVVTASNAAAVGLDPSTGSFAVHDCDGVPRGISYVFAPSGLLDPDRNCALAAATAGSMFGLEWTVQCDDIMGYDLSCSDKAFTSVSAPCGTTEPRPCACGGDQQSSYQRLGEAVGVLSCPAL